MDASDAWLSYEGVPLKWHYPLGLLYDLYSGTEPAYPDAEPAKRGDGSEDVNIPWRLTVHFSGYPLEKLVKLDADGKVLHDLFINNVKEVCIATPLSRFYLDIYIYTR